MTNTDSVGWQPIDIERMKVAQELSHRVTLAAAEATERLQTLLDAAAQFSTTHHQALLGPANAFADAVEAMIPDLRAALWQPAEWDPRT